MQKTLVQEGVLSCVVSHALASSQALASVRTGLLPHWLACSILVKIHYIITTSFSTLCVYYHKLHLDQLNTHDLYNEIMRQLPLPALYLQVMSPSITVRFVRRSRKAHRDDFDHIIATPTVFWRTTLLCEKIDYRIGGCWATQKLSTMALQTVSPVEFNGRKDQASYLQDLVSLTR